MRTFWVYILGSRSGTLYIGVTNDLVRRLAEHRSGIEESFVSSYAVHHRLLYFEQTSDVIAALTREKQLKGWSRRKKMDLIRSMNPSWTDLSSGW